MPTVTKIATPIYDGGAWVSAAAELAEWFWHRCVNRTDAWGRYSSLERRGKEYARKDGSKGKVPKSYTGKGQLTRAHLAAHFRATGPERVIGLHTTSPDNTSLWGAAEIDWHGEHSGSPEANWRAAQAWFDELVQQGFCVLLTDSNGNGGYHLRVLFSSPVPTAQLFAFLSELVRDHERHGLTRQPELFPKQGALTDKTRFGNWLRLPGRHHTTDHYARVWNGRTWLSGAEAVRFILSLPGVQPSLLEKRMASTEYRIKAYMKKLPHLGEGQGRDDVAYKFACWLVRDMKLSDQDALPWLDRWDCGNSPAKGKEALTEIMSNARKYGQRPVGCGLNGDATVQQEAMTAREQKDRADDERPKQSAAAGRVQMILGAGVDLFHDAEPKAYARVRVGNHREVWPVQSQRFKAWVQKLIWDLSKGNSVLAGRDEVLEMLKALALSAEPARELHVRVAHVGQAIYLDLGDPDWSAVKITTEGWNVIPDPPVMFRRPKGTLPLPLPVRGGSIEEFREFLNLKNTEAWILLVVFIVQCFFENGPFPILCVHGEHGTAKSTLARLVMSMTDPRATGLRGEPKDTANLLLAASNSWLVPLDNLSSIPRHLSDTLCRISTGGGSSARQLYSDDEETIFNIKRPIILTSINDVGRAEDLVDRALIITLMPIEDVKRKTEEELGKQFEVALPRILGAFLDLVAGALRELPGVILPSATRMADFCKLGVVVGRVLGWHKDDFPLAYRGNREEANMVVLDSSVLWHPIQDLLDDSEGSWEGSASELLAKLSGLVNDQLRKSEDWPKNAQRLSNALQRLAPALRKARVLYERGRTKGSGSSRVTRLRRIP